MKVASYPFPLAHLLRRGELLVYPWKLAAFLLTPKSHLRSPLSNLLAPRPLPTSWGNPAAANRAHISLDWTVKTHCQL